MSEYATYDTETGEYTNVYDLEDCLRAIRVRNRDNESRIKYLEAENKRLKEEHYKDSELQRMQERLHAMEAACVNGFPISLEESQAIEKWERQHEEEVHGLVTERLRMKAQGVSGGRYSYHFLPTTLGTSGVVRCCCGAEFEFREIG